MANKRAKREEIVTTLCQAVQDWIKAVGAKTNPLFQPSCADLCAPILTAGPTSERVDRKLLKKQFLITVQGSLIQPHLLAAR